MNRSGFAVLALLSAACACSSPETAAPADGASAENAMPLRGNVTDLPAFERFIATHPTGAEFEARYPDVHLVRPGDITTKEMRRDNSRYFARFDAQGRIVGGKFQ